MHHVLGRKSTKPCIQMKHVRVIEVLEVYLHLTSGIFLHISSMPVPESRVMDVFCVCRTMPSGS